MVFSLVFPPLLLGFLQVSNGIVEKRCHHQVCQACRCILTSLGLTEHALRAKIVEHRLQNRSLKPSGLLQFIERYRLLRANYRCKDIVLLRDAGRDERQRL